MSHKEEQWSGWKEFVLNHTVEALLAMIVFFVSQMNSKMQVMQEFNQVVDKRISAIEISRQEKLMVYERLLNDFENVKIKLTENSIILRQLQERKR